MGENDWDLSKLTTGERSALRKAAGSLAFNVAARRAFYKIESETNQSGEDQRYAALCFACIWRESDNARVLPMEDCLRTLCRENGEIVDGMAKRVDALLETRWAPDDYMLGKLSNLIEILHSRGEVRPNFKALADDLRRWNYENRPVQRIWLRTIYQDKHDAKDTNNEQSENINQQTEANHHDA